MNAFLYFLINNKKYLLISMSMMLMIGLIFGCCIYTHSITFFKTYLSSLLYLNIDQYQNQYTIYLTINILFIIITTYLSTSFIGTIGHLFIVFIKGIQIGMSLYKVFSTIHLSMIIIIIIILEILLEVIFVIVNSYMCMNFSLYNMMITFFVEENFNYKYIINYLLNILLISIAILMCLALFRIYFVSIL